MALDRFRAAFPVTAMEGSPGAAPFAESGVEGLGGVLAELGGRTFEHGLYRVLRADQVDEARQALEGVFPEYRARIVPFAYDWLGRHFACDLARVEGGQPQVLMLEVGAGEAMEIPAPVLDFHDVELVDYPDDALAAPFWRRWRSGHPADLGYGECVGYRVPLFLGGADELENLEVIDLSVYLEVCAQLRQKTLALAPGQTVRSVRFGR